MKDEEKPDKRANRDPMMGIKLPAYLFSLSGLAFGVAGSFDIATKFLMTAIILLSVITATNTIIAAIGSARK